MILILLGFESQLYGSIYSKIASTTKQFIYLRLAKIRTMARPNSPDMPPKRTKKVRLGIYRTQIQPKI